MLVVYNRALLLDPAVKDSFSRVRFSLVLVREHVVELR